MARAHRIHSPASGLDRFVDVGLICVLVFTPLAFGAVEDWAKAIAQSAVMLLVALWLLGRIWTSRPRTPLRRSGLEGPALLFVAVVALQLVPLPPSVLRVVSRHTAEIYARSLPGYGERGQPSFAGLPRWLEESAGADAAGASASAAPEAPEDAAIGALPAEVFERGHPAWRPLSLDPAATARALQIVVVHLMLLFLVCQRAGRAAWVLRYLYLLAGLAGGMAVLAIFQYLTAPELLYWWRASAPGSSPFGPFVSRNNFSGWMELVLPSCVGLAAMALGSSLEGREARDGLEGREGRGAFARAAGPGRLRPAALLLGFASVFGLVAFLFARSRGGLLSLSGAVALYACVSLARERARPRRLVALALTVAVAVALVAWIGGAEVWSRYGTLTDVSSEPSFRFRLATTLDTLGMAREFPLLGTGLGTFEQAFQLYAPGTSYKLTGRAHDDYAQLLADTGVLGGLALIWALIVLVRRGILPGLTRLGWSLRWPMRGVAVGVLALLIHSLVDFNLQIYSNSLLFAFLCALLLRDAADDLELNGISRRAEGRG